MKKEEKDEDGDEIRCSSDSNIGCLIIVLLIAFCVHSCNTKTIVIIDSSQGKIVKEITP